MEAAFGADLSGVTVREDPALEAEADEAGRRAVRGEPVPAAVQGEGAEEAGPRAADAGPTQRMRDVRIGAHRNRTLNVPLPAPAPALAPLPPGYGLIPYVGELPPVLGAGGSRRR